MLLMLFLVIIPSLLLFFTPEPGKAVILQQCPIFSLIKQQRAVFLKGTGWACKYTRQLQTQLEPWTPARRGVMHEV